MLNLIKSNQDKGCNLAVSLDEPIKVQGIVCSMYGGMPGGLKRVNPGGCTQESLEDNKFTKIRTMRANLVFVSSTLASRLFRKPSYDSG